MNIQEIKKKSLELVIFSLIGASALSPLYYLGHVANVTNQIQEIEPSIEYSYYKTNFQFKDEIYHVADNKVFKETENGMIRTEYSYVENDTGYKIMDPDEHIIYQYERKMEFHPFD